MKKIAVVNGPNLNLLGVREPEKYGNTTYLRLVDELVEFGKKLNARVDVFQSNIEGELVDFIQDTRTNYDGLIINAGGYTHTSVAIRDAIAACGLPTVEVHITNIAAREAFRHTSLITSVCKGSILGLGIEGYKLSLLYLIG